LPKARYARENLHFAKARYARDAFVFAKGALRARGPSLLLKARYAREDLHFAKARYARDAFIFTKGALRARGPSIFAKGALRARGPPFAKSALRARCIHEMSTSQEVTGPPPLAADGYQQLAGEGEDFDAVVAFVTDVQLVGVYRQVWRIELASTSSKPRPKWRWVPTSDISEA